MTVRWDGRVEWRTPERFACATDLTDLSRERPL